MKAIAFRKRDTRHGGRTLSAEYLSTERRSKRHVTRPGVGGGVTVGPHDMSIDNNDETIL